MSAETILAILSAIGELLSIAQAAPTVIEEAKSLLAKVAPHVDATNAEVRRAFEQAQARVPS